jgi:hypothetical protein
MLRCCSEPYLQELQHICREYCNLGIFENRCCICAHWHSEFSDSNLNKLPNRFDPFWKGFILIFFSLCPSSGIVLHRVNQKFEVVFPIYGLWLTILWTFSKVCTDILSLFCLNPPVMTWIVGLYLNGELWQVHHVYIVYIKGANNRSFYDMFYQVLVSGIRVVC